ncbi:MAG: hypothetical protein KGH58_01215 [Candidatus Micrarchaeota archaeon]|nr:hypothetical protein [Candidatus Micrarchaeota archaeon]
MTIGGWRIELGMAAAVIAIDVAADTLQSSYGVPVIMRVVTNVGIFLGVISLYIMIRVMAMRRSGKKWGSSRPLAVALFGR